MKITITHVQSPDGRHDYWLVGEPLAVCETKEEALEYAASLMEN